ncbi:U5 small nuclear ribonucleoprotein helicase [Prunus dulcis]|uniref:U5 small nuclear ribonucleoprotein helicase n=1 Tax=Prunus dulcis TaxID=3755 RepID=A0A4Y1R7L1_PRUDU|nr:U5 small nuclear ribonucleoprotein helicase [Prunus dulcis]
MFLRALRHGTVRKHHKGYEEVIPPTPTAQMKTWEKLVPIRSSITLLHVCAPTGACKTNVAMISILHEIRQMIGYSGFLFSFLALAAEVTSTFSHRLSPLNITVRELTGDMQLYKNELEETQMIVATPEKWDVITHKSSHMSLSMLLQLMLMKVGEVESTQTMIRIVGLSATLPNYLEFLRVNPEAGLFFFISSYRSVRLAQQYIGISEQNFTAHIELQNERCYKKFVESLRKGYQAMFISSLKDNLNAEVARGTVTNVKEACEWLGYMYLFIRMRLNPLVYGIGWDEVVADPSLSLKQRVLIADAARALDKAKMMCFDEKNMVAHSSEIENIVVRDEEQNELETLVRSSCPLEVKGTPKKHGKISILIQMYRSCGSIDTFSLVIYIASLKAIVRPPLVPSH